MSKRSAIQLCNLSQSETYCCPTQWVIINCNTDEHPSTQLFYSILTNIEPDCSSIDYIQVHDYVSNEELDTLKSESDSLTEEGLKTLYTTVR